MFSRRRLVKKKIQFNGTTFKKKLYCDFTFKTCQMDIFETTIITQKLSKNRVKIKEDEC